MNSLQTSLKILIGDDDPDDVALIGEMIREGSEVFPEVIDVARNLEETLELLHESAYDICLLDYRLGKEDGIHLLQQIKEKILDVPVILITNFGNSSLAVKAMKLGAYDYLDKAHLSIESLNKAIFQTIQLHELNRKKRNAEKVMKKQDRLFKGVAEASSKLLTIRNHSVALGSALSLLGETLSLSKVFLLQHKINSETNFGELKQIMAWESRTDRVVKDDGELIPSYGELGSFEWYERLLQRQPVVYRQGGPHGSSAGWLLSHGIQSLLLIPIFYDDYYWGVVAFADCEHVREWTSNEIAILETAAINFGGTIRAQRDHNAFRSIIEGTSSGTGDDFFNLLVKNLARALSVKHVRLVEYFEYDSSQVREIVGWENGSYSAGGNIPTKDSPMVETMAGMVSFYGDDVQQAFPDYTPFKKDRIISFAGVPFLDASMKVIGHLAVGDEKPLVDRERTISFLKIFATRAGAELQRKRAEETIKNMAYYDHLTGLPNRVLLNDRLNVALAQAKRNRSALGVMYLDFDHFKEVNDKHGHDIGDQLLQEITRALKQCLRQGDTLARLGGDEFVLVQPRINGKEDCEKLAKKLLELARQPFQVGELTLYLTLSLGISRFPEDGESGKVLILKADQALYQAKKNGRDNHQFYSKDSG